MVLYVPLGKIGNDGKLEKGKNMEDWKKGENWKEGNSGKRENKGNKGKIWYIWKTEEIRKIMNMETSWGWAVPSSGQA